MFKMYRERVNIKLIKNIFLFVTFAIMPLSTFCQYKLTIEISGLKNNNGQVHVELNNEANKLVKGISQAVTNKACIIVIDNLKPGKYAFKYFHDENNNKNIDLSWMGIPKEGFGFSNNAAATFGPPPLKKTIFVITGNTKVKCHPVYY